ncbi:MAG: glycoside hydrolase family 3 N-terminal domain-containing protein [Anaerolineaceae bacterium]|nr:glycoside hydrolase family 3 N-terminal domain-containing protein [Anaerolineaceae bacterium]
MDIHKAEKRLQPGIGQVTRIGGNSIQTPAEIARSANRVQKILVENTRLGIPAIVHEECCSGAMFLGATLFPQMIGLACSFKPELAFRMTDIIRQQCRALGLHQGLAPVLDVGRDPRWGRIEETFGEDPFLISQFGVEYIRGLQTDDLKNGVMATGKHFIGHSFSMGGLNCAPVPMGPRTLKETYLYPFEAAIRKANLATMMNSYPEIDGDVVAATPTYLTDLLRGELGFDGLIVSDYQAISMLKTYHWITEDLTEAAILSIRAGIEVELPTNETFNEALIAAIENGALEMELVDRAVARHLTKKFELGLFEQPYVVEADFSDLMDGPDKRTAAAEIAKQSMVLLSNNGLLPLSKDLKTIAVIGPNADDSRCLQSDYSYSAVVELQMYQHPEGSIFTNFDPSTLADEKVKVPSILSALKKFNPNTRFVYARGADLNTTDVSDISSAVKVAGEADAVVLVLGERSGLAAECTCGETRDSADLCLSVGQMELARAVFALGKPVVVVLVNGRPLAIAELVDQADAVLEAWVPGEEGGLAIAETLFGQNNPGGKLCITFPRSVGQIPVFYNHKPSGSKSNWFTNYVNESVTPLFPFGHGLSYTQFAYSDLNIEKPEVGAGETIKISCEVRNAGKVAGDEVVQLYLQDEIGSLPRPVKELKGFVRLSLQPGEQKNIQFDVPVNLMAFFDRDLHLVVEAGKINVFIGSSSEDIRLKGEFTICGAQKMPIKQREYSCPVQVL